MAIDYQPIEDIIQADGLRLVLVKGFPSPWGQAAKAMMEYKELSYSAGALEVRQENAVIAAWSGVNSAPVVAWKKEAPLNKWDDILMLLERLVPDRPLVPKGLPSRLKFFGLAYAICGELGFGWNRRLDGIQSGVKAGMDPGPFGVKYGYNQTDGELAEQRSIDFLQELARTLKGQLKMGSEFILGNSVTALDFYWAAFSNLAKIQSAEDCPLEQEIRARFERVSPAVLDAIDPILIEHRDRIMRAYFKLPMEL
jgi:glutathione S-transferase